MLIACWTARYSFVGFEGSVVSGRRAELDGFREELVDTVVGTACFEDPDSLEERYVGRILAIVLLVEQLLLLLLLFRGR